MFQKDRIPMALAAVMLLGLLIHLRSVTGVTVKTSLLMSLTLFSVLILSLAEHYEAVRTGALAAGAGLLFAMLSSPVIAHPLMPGFQPLKTVQVIESLTLGSQGFSDMINSLFYYALDYEKYPFSEGPLFYTLITCGLTAAAWQIFRSDHRRRLKLLVPMVVILAAWFQGYKIDTGFILYFAGYAGYLFTSSGERGAVGLLIAGVAMLIGAGLYTIYPVEETIRRLDDHFGQGTWLRTEYSPFSGGNFSFQDTIYEPLENRLGGPVSLKRDRLFSVRSDHGGHLYLRGRVLTLYDGKSWRKEPGDLEIFYLDQPSPRRGSGEARFDLELFGFQMQTKTVFAPLGVNGIDLPVELLRRDRYGVIYLDRSLSELEEGYKLSTFQLPASRLESGTEYFQLPENYSEAVVTLTRSLTSQVSDPSQKVEALRDYLSSLTYSLSPGIPNPDMDFVEQFLFGEQKGYCTYFASAMVVMSRAAGVPARYVEGFLTPYSSNADGDYVVTADRAHAWAEVYLNGHWVVAEATPAYLTETATSAPFNPILSETGDAVVNENRPEGDLELEPEMGETPETIGLPANSLWTAGTVLLFLALVLCAVLYKWQQRKRRETPLTVRLADDIMTLLVIKHGISQEDWEEMTPRELIDFAIARQGNEGLTAPERLDARRLTTWMDRAYYSHFHDEGLSTALRGVRDAIIKNETSTLKQWKYRYWIYLKGERVTWS